MSVTYANEVENVGTGGMGMGGMSGGLVIFFLLLFFIFNRGGLGTTEAVAATCHGTSSCQVDKDVIISRYENEMVTTANADRVIANATTRASLEDERLIQSQALKISQLETFNYINQGNAAIMAELCKKANVPPIYAQAMVASGYQIPPNGCGNSYC